MDPTYLTKVTINVTNYFSRHRLGRRNMRLLPFTELHALIHQIWHGEEARVLCTWWLTTRCATRKHGSRSSRDSFATKLLGLRARSTRATGRYRARDITDQREVNSIYEFKIERVAQRRRAMWIHVIPYTNWQQANSLLFFVRKPPSFRDFFSSTVYCSDLSDTLAKKVCAN